MTWDELSNEEKGKFVEYVLKNDKFIKADLAVKVTVIDAKTGDELLEPEIVMPDTVYTDFDICDLRYKSLYDFRFHFRRNLEIEELYSLYGGGKEKC